MEGAQPIRVLVVDDDQHVHRRADGSPRAGRALRGRRHGGDRPRGGPAGEDRQGGGRADGHVDAGARRPGGDAAARRARTRAVRDRPQRSHRRPLPCGGARSGASAFVTSPRRSTSSSTRSSPPTARE